MESIAEKFHISIEETKTWMDNVFATWPRNTDINFFLTYPTETRADIYDNSLVANLYTMMGVEGQPPPSIANEIIESFLTRIEVLESTSNPANRLLPAAYGPSGTSVQDAAQDVGNNTMVCIAILKFISKYPTYRDRGIAAVSYIFNVYFNHMNCGSSISGIHRRWVFVGEGSPPPPPGTTAVSTEHMVDLVAAAHLGTEVGIPLSQELLLIAQTFVASMYGDERFFIGSLDDCVGINMPEYPSDTSTWNMLAHARDDQTEMVTSLKTVFTKNFFGTDGLAFALPRTQIITDACYQCENAYSGLCALQAYNRKYNEDILTTTFDQDLRTKIEASFSLLHTRQGTPIQAAYDNTVDSNGYSGCGAVGCCNFIGSGFSYPLSAHLASTVYGILALAMLSNSGGNIYRDLNITPSSSPTPTPTTPTPTPTPTPESSSSSTGIFIVVISSILLTILVIVVLMLALIR
jgi:hypothetical protein